MKYIILILLLSCTSAEERKLQREVDSLQIVRDRLKHEVDSLELNFYK